MMIAGYRLNMDALLARMIYRWHWRIALLIALLGGALGVAGGVIPPIWRGAADLLIEAEPAAQLFVDGRPWPFPIYAGTHHVAAVFPDGREVSTVLALTPGVTTTLRLPPPLVVRERRILPAAPGLQIANVEWADNAWRVVSTTPPSETDADSPEPAPTGGMQTLAITAHSATRLAMLDAYAGLADDVRVGEHTLTAQYRPTAADMGLLEVRGWASAPVTEPLSETLVLLRFAPNGAILLFGERIAGGVQISLLQKNGERLPVTALPGNVLRLDWHPDGDAVVIHSRSGGRQALTLVRLKPDVAAATIADLPAERYAGALIPIDFQPDRLFWVVPDSDGTTYLWSATPAALVPERLRALDAVAVQRLPNGDLRAAVVDRDRVLIGRYVGDLLIVEATLEQVPVTPDLAGLWAGDLLLLRAADQVWLVAPAEGA